MAGHESQRVRQSKQNHVVFLVRPLHVCPAVVDDHVDSRVVVWAIGVAVDSDLVQGPIDLDGIYVPDVLE